MADSAVTVTAGSGTNIDTRTEGTNGHHRQVIVIGDPATNAGVAPVDATLGVAANILGIGGTATSVNAGTVDAGTQRVVLASDTVNANGRAAEASSAPVALSDEDFASLQAVETAVESAIAGLSIYRTLDLDESEEEVKATAGKLYKLRITNFATSPRYVKLYNATAASTTVGTTTPLDTIPIPAASASDCVVLTEAYGGRGLTFSTALSIACTTALADADTGAPSANDVVVSVYYE